MTDTEAAAGRQHHCLAWCKRKVRAAATAGIALTCSPKTRPVIKRGRGAGGANAAQSVQRGTDYRDLEGSAGGQECAGGDPALRDRRGDVLPVAGAVRGGGTGRGAADGAAGAGEPAAQADGGGVEPGQGSAEVGDRKKRLAPVARRAAVSAAMAHFSISQRRACRLVA